MPEKLMRKLIRISFTFKGRADEATRLQPFDISKIPTRRECIISLKLMFNERYFDTESRRLSKKWRIQKI